MSHVVIRRVALLLGVGSLLMLAATLWLSSLNGALLPDAEDAALMVAFYGYLVIGLLLVSRRPRNLVGWILAGVGLLTNLGALTEEYAKYSLVTAPGTPGGVLAAWFQSWWWLANIAAVFLFIPMLFPTGRSLSPRWGWVTRAAVVSVVAACTVSALTPVLSDRDGLYEVANPIGVSWGGAEEGPLSAVFAAVFAATALAALVSVAVRFRRSRGVERQQLKVFLYAVVVTVGVSFIEDLDLLPAGTGSDVVFSALILLPPAAIAVAVLRYRLYEIDRLISRTLTYALLTAVLLGLYLGAVTALTTITAPVTDDSPFAVAAATLVAAGAFSPARRRIQRAVDRRFNRARYDAAQTVDEFRSRLRDELDLESITASVQTAMQRTVQPTRSLVWLRSEARS